jgi:hypothetical protein
MNATWPCIFTACVNPSLSRALPSIMSMGAKPR